MLPCKNMSGAVKAQTQDLSEEECEGRKASDATDKAARFDRPHKASSGCHQGIVVQCLTDIECKSGKTGTTCSI